MMPGTDRFGQERNGMNGKAKDLKSERDTFWEALNSGFGLCFVLFFECWLACFRVKGTKLIEWIYPPIQ